MDEPTRITVSESDLQRSAMKFIQRHGEREELDWRWERHGMLVQFIAELFGPQNEPQRAGVPTSKP